MTIHPAYFPVWCWHGRRTHEYNAVMKRTGCGRVGTIYDTLTNIQGRFRVQYNASKTIDCKICLKAMARRHV